jgi:hypothetical protein
MGKEGGMAGRDRGEEEARRGPWAVGVKVLGPNVISTFWAWWWFPPKEKSFHVLDYH